MLACPAHDRLTGPSRARRQTSRAGRCRLRVVRPRPTHQSDRAAQHQRFRLGNRGGFRRLEPGDTQAVRRHAAEPGGVTQRQERGSCPWASPPRVRGCAPGRSRQPRSFRPGARAQPRQHGQQAQVHPAAPRRGMEEAVRCKGRVRRMPRAGDGTGQPAWPRAPPLLLAGPWQPATASTSRPGGTAAARPTLPPPSGLPGWHEAPPPSSRCWPTFAGRTDRAG